MYALFGLIVLSSAMLMLGLFYRVASVIFFTCFTYVELIDKAFYLNHYYLVSIIAFLMLFVPAHRYFSIDTYRNPERTVSVVPGWCINIFKLQLVLVYFFAGISKIGYDWLILATPLRIWLPADADLPVIGAWLGKVWVAYTFSWFGMLFDLCIGFLLLYPKTTKPAYVLVVIFHLFTGLLFNIGVFPYLMIFVTTIFFSEKTHLAILGAIRRLFRMNAGVAVQGTAYQPQSFLWKSFFSVLALHFVIQLLLPMRYLLYPGPLFWTEEGYRFSWRVMLMEKGGTAFFYVTDPASGRMAEVDNTKYLTTLQEKMMGTQPDMILQYAGFLADVYQKKGIRHPRVTVDSYVSLNGSGSRPYIDKTVNLAGETESFRHKSWILPFQK